MKLQKILYPRVLTSHLYYQDGEKNEDTPYFIDDSIEIFRHVLDYMRDSNYPFNKKYRYKLDYYGINYDENMLYDEDKKIDELNKMSEQKIQLKKEKLLIQMRKDGICLTSGCLRTSFTDYEGHKFYYCKKCIKN